MSQQLGAMLQRAGMLTPQELDASIRQANARKISLWDLLVVERRVPEESLTAAFSACLNVPRVSLASATIDARAVKAVPERVARQHTCLPLRIAGRDLVLVMANPLDQQAIQDVQFVSSRQVQPVVASRTEILDGINTHYTPGRPAAEDDTDDEDAGVFGAAVELDLTATARADTAADSPAVSICRQIMLAAIDLRASDIHIEPASKDVRVRLRIDGVLRDHLNLPRWMHTALVSRIKILARLDIAQQRLPQDGRIKLTHQDHRIDLRVSTLPTHFGEKVVLRLLGSSAIPALESLGLSELEASMIDDAVSQPQGLILVTGPTGAGKSTTLYSMLTRRHSDGLNVVTIEDPIEYQVAGINQVQVDVKAGLTFASSLRAILRQDPDVILVGEIRDRETAEIAVQAALTGHLVFSTLHTNGSVAAIERLLDLDVKPLLITAATNLIIAQRLARRICPGCRAAYAPAADVLRKLKMAPGESGFTRGAGCRACGQTGYTGRIGIFEILRLTRPLKDAIAHRRTEADMRRAAVGAATRFLLDDAIAKVRQGLTTVEEVLRVIRIDPDDDGPAGAGADLTR